MHNEHPIAGPVEAVPCPDHAGESLETGSPDPSVPSADGKEFAASVLRQVGCSDVAPYMNYDFGRKQDERCVSTLLSVGDAFTLATFARKRVAPGWAAFVGTTHWRAKGVRRGRAELVIAPVSDQFDIIRVARTAAPDCGIGTETIVEKLKEYDAAYGIDIVHAEANAVTFDLQNPPENGKQLLADILKFCPDRHKEIGSYYDHSMTHLCQVRRERFWWDRPCCA